MCFQGFVYFIACGHASIVHRECELAAAIDFPFYNILLCPDYASTSERADQFCGIGRYYCKHFAEAAFLDSAHQKGDLAQEHIARTDERLSLVRTGINQLIESIGSHPLLFEELKQSPRYLSYDASAKTLMQERARGQSALAASHYIIARAQDHFDRLRQHQQSGDGSAFPALTLPRGYPDKVPAELIALAPADTLAQSAANGSKVAARGAAVRLAGPQPANLHRPMSTPGMLSQQSTVPEGDNIYVARRRTIVPEQHLKLSRRVQSFGVSGSDIKVVQPSPPKSWKDDQQLHDEAQETPAPQRRGRKPGHKAKASLSEEPSSVRRSTRVRSKTVNYAEESNSEPASREPSPVKSDRSFSSPIKSDISNFSPDKSELSDSLEKSDGLSREARCRPAGSTSLLDKIGDWKRRGNLAPPQATTSTGSRMIVGSQGQSSNPVKDIRSTTKSGSRGDNFIMQPPNDHQPVPNGALAPPILAIGDQHNPTSALNLYHRMMHGDAAATLSGYPNASGVRRSLTQRDIQSTSEHQLGGMRHFSLPPFNLTGHAGASSSTPADGAADMQHSLAANYGSQMERVDSVQPHAEQMPATPSWEKMPRGFSSAVDFTPSAFANRTSPSTDPRKRSLPASSSAVSAKRLCLPASVEASARMSYGHSFHAVDSHSAEASSEQEWMPEDGTMRISNASRPAAEAEDAPSMTVPMAPTAVMYLPSELPPNEVRDAEAKLGAVMMQSMLGGDHRDETGFDFSDIDWGMADEAATVDGTW